jgi:hypothetical protein
MAPLLVVALVAAQTNDAAVPPAAQPVAGAEVKSAPLTPRGQPVGFGLQMASGVAAAVVFVPASLYLGAWLGSLSNDLIWSALPALLCMGLLPPVAVTLATWIAGNWGTQGRHRLWPSLIATLIINGVSLPIAASLGLSVGLAGRVLLYTVAQAVLQPAAATALMRAWPLEPQVLTQADPIAPRTFVVPTAAWSF